MAIIGIDLGTTNSLCAVWKDGAVRLIPDSLGNLMVPSVVAVDMDGNVLVGQAAKEEELLHPERCASNFKRFMGTTKVYHLADRTFTPEELSALVLKKIKEMAEEYLQEKVTESIISVPAYFNNEQRYATKLAADLAGVYCERLINEPSAAALTARQQDGATEQLMLVFDFGGGTLDISIVDCFENIVEITTIAGDNHLGGTDFDQTIALAFCAENQLAWENLSEQEKTRLLYESRRCKETLSTQNEAEMTFSYKEGTPAVMSLDTQKLLQISQRLFRRIKNVISKALQDSGRTLDEISTILLAGGSSRMPVVQLFLSRLFGRELFVGEEPHLLIAKGIGIYTAIKERDGDLKDILMTDVCPFSLGTEIAGETPNAPTRMHMMIERNSILPCRTTSQFVTAGDFQTRIRFKIYQGEHLRPEQNLLIGAVEISVPAAPAGNQSVTVTFSYNINGILEVTVVSDTTGETINTTLVSGYKRLSAEQISAKKEQIEALRFLSKEEEDRTAILSMGERLYAEATGPLRQYIESILGQYHYAWHTGSPVSIRKEGVYAMQKLLAIDMSLKQSLFRFSDGEFEDRELGNEAFEDEEEQ